MPETIIFIYVKEGFSKVLSMGQPVKHAELNSEGWKHTCTLNARIWVQNLLNMSDEAKIEEIKSLTNSK